VPIVVALIWQGTPFAHLYGVTGIYIKRTYSFGWDGWGAFDSVKNHKRQRRKRQSVTAKRKKGANAKVRIG